MKRVVLLFLVIALLYAGAGLFPGRTFAPVDLLLDFDAWKADPTQRVRVSNSLLSDVVVQFMAWDHEVIRLLRDGQQPWANRFAGEGGALFANPQTALFSPFTWPRLLLGLDGWAISSILKLLAATLCLYWMARELNVPAPQALVSAVVFAISGFCVVWLLYPPTNVVVLLPGLGAAALRFMKEPRRCNAALLVLFAALCTAGGHPEALFVGVSGLGVFLLWEAKRNPQLGLLSAAHAGLGAGFGFLLLGAQLVPFFALLAQSHAGGARPGMEHSFRLWGVLSQVLPGVLGSPLRGELDLTAVARAESFHFRAGGFIGAIVLVAIAVAWRSLSPVLRHGLVIGSVALVLSWHPPGAWFFFRHVPVVRLLAFEYGVILFVLFGSLAAGPAIATLASAQRNRIGVALMAAGAVAISAGALPALSPARPTLTSMVRSGIEGLRARGHLRQPAEVYEARLDYYLSAAGETALHRVALPGALWFVGGVFLVFPLRRRELLLACAATGELVVFGLGFNPAVRMSDLPLEPAAITAIRRIDPAQNYLFAASFEVFPANAGTIYGVRDVISYDVLTSIARARELEAAGYDDRIGSFPSTLSPAAVERLAALGVRWVLSRSAVPNARRLEGPPPPAVGVYELANAAALPPPLNQPPVGLGLGIAISVLAVGGCVLWLMLCVPALGACAAGRQREV
ncbi:MAG: hypothetical protein ABI689_04625 [Thermoanaerobaculia bacterium]